MSLNYKPYPNYFTLNAEVYLYRNIHRKQALINFLEKNKKKELEKNKNFWGGFNQSELYKNQSASDILNTQVMNSIMQQESILENFGNNNKTDMEKSIDEFDYSLEFLVENIERAQKGKGSCFRDFESLQEAKKNISDRNKRRKNNQNIFADKIFDNINWEDVNMDSENLLKMQILEKDKNKKIKKIIPHILYTADKQINLSNHEDNIKNNIIIDFQNNPIFPIKENNYLFSSLSPNNQNNEEINSNFLSSYMTPRDENVDVLNEAKIKLKKINFLKIFGCLKLNSQIRKKLLKNQKINKN